MSQAADPAPLISIIVATYNCAGVLPGCLASIAAQGYPNRELIVADGGSNDGTLEVIRANAADITHWQSEPDKGVYDAWNKALVHARGEWVCFLGADDRFHDSDTLEVMALALSRALPAHRLVYGRLNIVSAGGGVIETLERPWPEIKPQFLAGTLMLPHPGSFHHRSLFESHGVYDPGFRIAGDYDLMLRELKTADALYVREQIVVDMGFGGMSANPRNMYLGLTEIARARAKNGIATHSPTLSLRRMLALAGVLVLNLFGRNAFNVLADAYRRLGRRDSKWSRKS